nr:DoxX family protein [Moraxella nasovis]
MMTKLCSTQNRLARTISQLDFVPLVAIRVYLAPIFIIAGLHKWLHFSDMVAWFGNDDWGLGLPMPALMVSLAIFAELVGGVAILFGIATRLFSIPMLIAMLVALFKVHWEHGWFAIAPSDPATSTAQFFAWFNIDLAQQSLANSVEVGERLGMARQILEQHGNMDWLTETGNFVVLNNGIEFAATYVVMLLVLLFFGAGKFLSVDYWLAKAMHKHTQPKTITYHEMKTSHDTFTKR